MKKIIMVIMVLFVPLIAVAGPQYETPLLDLTVPSGLDSGQMYFDFGHKMLQSLYQYPSNNTFALLKNGATLNLNVRYMVWNGIEVKAGYDTEADEKNIGVSYVYKFTPQYFNAQADLQFFSYDDPARYQTARNFFYLLSLQTVPLWDNRITAAVDFGYNGYFKNFSIGTGLSVMVIKDVTLVAEYYTMPMTFDENEGGGGEEQDPGCFTFGIKYSTYGHQFMLKFSNSTSMETRQLMQGAPNNNIYVGISIMRLIDFANPEN